MKSKKEIIDQIPTSWETFKFKDYLKCVDVVISEGNEDEIDELFSGLDNTISVISKLTDISVDELESMEFSFIQEIGKRMSFATEMPTEQKHCCIKWKKIDEVSYNDFVSFLNLSRDAVHGMGEIIKTFSRNELTDDEINEMSVAEVYTGFFILNAYVRKYLRRMMIRDGMKLLRQSTKTLIRQKLRIRGKK